MADEESDRIMKCLVFRIAIKGNSNSSAFLIAISSAEKTLVDRVSDQFLRRLREGIKVEHDDCLVRGLWDPSVYAQMLSGGQLLLSSVNKLHANVLFSKAFSLERGKNFIVIG